MSERIVTLRAVAFPTEILVLALLGLFSMAGHFLGELSVVAFLVIFWLLLERIGYGRLPILEFLATISALQWLLAPYLSYTIGEHHPKYHMYVDADVYFDFALPGTLAFVIALLIPIGRQSRMITPSIDSGNFRIGIFLVACGTVGRFLQPYAPGSLRYVLFLVGLTTYVGAFYCLYSNHRWRWGLAFFALGTTILSSIRETMFHDLIILSAFGFFVWASLRERSRSSKIFVISCGLCVVIVIQLVKREYRELDVRGLGTFFELVTERVLKNEADDEDEGISDTLFRFNQGWIISAVMANVPGQVPFAGGRTVADAAKAAFVPRLFLDKATAGGAELVKEFTGLRISVSTSMGLSILGEAYANFGRMGGIAMMFIVGLLFNRLMKWLRGRVMTNPHFFLWLPFVFYQSIKAETDSLVVMNQLVKGTVMALFLFWCVNQVFRSKIPGPALGPPMNRTHRSSGNLLRDPA